MRVLVTALSLLLGCRAEDAASETANHIDPSSIAFVAQCRYANGARILIAHRFASDAYRFIISRGDYNEVSSIRISESGDLEIETNGGVGKIVAVSDLFHWLLGQPFRAVDENAFVAETTRDDVSTCPGQYPFSP